MPSARSRNLARGLLLAILGTPLGLAIGTAARVVPPEIFWGFFEFGSIAIGVGGLLFFLLALVPSWYRDHW